MNNYTIFVKYFIIQMEIIQYKLNNKIRIEKNNKTIEKVCNTPLKIIKYELKTAH